MSSHQFKIELALNSIINFEVLCNIMDGCKWIFYDRRDKNAKCLPCLTCLPLGSMHQQIYYCVCVEGDTLFDDHYLL